MKFLKIFLLVIGVLVAAFFATGLIVPEIEYESEVAVDAPVDRAFGVFIDPTKTAEWFPGFKDIKLIKGFPYSEGSSYELTMEVDGETMVMTEVITAFKPNELFAFDLDNDMMKVEKAVHFSPNGDQTAIRTVTKVRGKNLFFRSMFAFYTGAFGTQEDQMNNKLSEVIEADR